MTTTKEDLFYLGVKALIVNQQGQILLLQSSPRNYLNHRNIIFWDFPGGKINPGESPEKTLQREVKEETGIINFKMDKDFVATISPLRIVHSNNQNRGLILFVYRCSVENETKITLSPEHQQFAWFSPQKASKLLAIKYPKSFTKYVAQL